MERILNSEVLRTTMLKAWKTSEPFTVQRFKITPLFLALKMIGINREF